MHYVQVTSVGRGRGWRSNWDKGLPLHPPGETTAADMEVDSLIAAVQSINLTGGKESVATLKEVEELLKTQCQAEEDLRWIVYVWNRILSSHCLPMFQHYLWLIKYEVMWHTVTFTELRFFYIESCRSMFR